MTLLLLKLLLKMTIPDDFYNPGIDGDDREYNNGPFTVEAEDTVTIKSGLLTLRRNNP